MHTLLCLAARKDARRAAALLFAYMEGLHIPLLVARLHSRGAAAGLACMACATAACFAHRWPPIDRDGVYWIGHKEQLVVACHALLSLSNPSV